MSYLVDLSKDAFAFLEDDFGFSLESSCAESWGGQFTYRNLEKRIVVRLQFDFPAAFFYVFADRLSGSKLADNGVPSSYDSRVACFDLTEMLRRSTSDARHRDRGEAAADDFSGNLRNCVRKCATRLQAEGKDLLRGHLSQPPDARGDRQGESTTPAAGKSSTE